MLVRDIVAVISMAVEKGGDSVLDYPASFGNPGDLSSFKEIRGAGLVAIIDKETLEEQQLLLLSEKCQCPICRVMGDIIEDVFDKDCHKGYGIPPSEN